MLLLIYYVDKQKFLSNSIMQSCKAIQNKHNDKSAIYPEERAAVASLAGIFDMLGKEDECQTDALM